MEEMLIDSESMRRFAGINLMDDPVPDETTILKFRHLLEEHGLTERLFRDVGLLLTERGLMLHKGTIVDATEEMRAARGWCCCWPRAIRGTTFVVACRAAAASSIAGASASRRSGSPGCTAGIAGKRRACL